MTINGASHSQTSETTRKYLRRIERLGRQLLAVKVEGAQGLWDWQLSILNLQREIQASISSEKERPRDSRNHDSISQLRMCRLRARQLGDAFAWVAFKLDRKQLRSLSANARVPISQQGHGSRGVEIVSAHLAGQGWGFPILHDITDCLRIGDVTFVRPDREDHPFVTVEMKTRIINTERTPEGKTAEECKVEVLSTLELAPDGTVVSTPLSRGLTLSQYPAAKDRVDRQLRRMAEAAFRTLSDDGVVVDLGNRGHISTRVITNRESHWKELRAVIRGAHRDGYAGMCVDKAFFYAAFYKPSGIDTATMQRPSFVEDVVGSGFLIPDAPEKNAIIINQIASPSEDRQSPYFLPFFLFNITKRSIFEMLRGELAVVVLVNPEQVVRFLESRGYDVRLTDRQMGGDSLSVRQEFTDTDGRAWFCEMRALEHHVQECVFELRPIEHLSDLIDGMAKVTQDSHQQILAATSARGK